MSNRLTKADIVEENKRLQIQNAELFARLQLCEVTFKLIRKQLMFVCTQVPDESDEYPSADTPV